MVYLASFEVVLTDVCQKW